MINFQRNLQCARLISVGKKTIRLFVLVRDQKLEVSTSDFKMMLPENTGRLQSTQYLHAKKEN